MGDDPGEIYSPPAGGEPERLNASNYRISAEDRLGEGSLKQKCRDNFAAIELVRKLDAEDRAATDEEKRVARQICRLGRNSAGLRLARRRRIGKPNATSSTRCSLPEEYEAARASTLNAHYTSADCHHRRSTRRVQRLGFTHGRVLEPALGIGHFFGLMPEEMSARSRLTGIELDPLTASIARQALPRCRHSRAGIRDRGARERLV